MLLPAQYRIFVFSDHHLPPNPPFLTHNSSNESCVIDFVIPSSFLFLYCPFQINHPMCCLRKPSNTEQGKFHKRERGPERFLLFVRFEILCVWVNVKTKRPRDLSWKFRLVSHASLHFFVFRKKDWALPEDLVFLTVAEHRISKVQLKLLRKQWGSILLTGFLTNVLLVPTLFIPRSVTSNEDIPMTHEPPDEPCSPSLPILISPPETSTYHAAPCCVHTDAHCLPVSSSLLSAHFSATGHICFWNRPPLLIVYCLPPWSVFTPSTCPTSKCKLFTETLPDWVMFTGTIPANYLPSSSRWPTKPLIKNQNQLRRTWFVWISCFVFLFLLFPEGHLQQPQLRKQSAQSQQLSEGFRRPLLLGMQLRKGSGDHPIRTVRRVPSWVLERHLQKMRDEPSVRASQFAAESPEIVNLVSGEHRNEGQGRDPDHHLGVPEGLLHQTQDQ